MQRVRMSLPYYKDFGWDATVVCVAEKFSEMKKDDLLLESLPNWIEIITINAFSKKWTSKFGLGSLALRSMFFYIFKIKSLLKTQSFDLIYFSTTQFPITILGSYWKKKYNIPFVVDMQDPWYSDYYKNKPKAEQPAKYWFSYRLNKYLEPITMHHVDGIISVSQAYIDTLKSRYLNVKNIPTEVITFGAFYKDIEIANKHLDEIELAFEIVKDTFNIVYIGRGGHDMNAAVTILFVVFKQHLTNNPSFFKRVKLHFIGTSYAPKGKGNYTILPIAKKLGIENYVLERTDRVSFYSALASLASADALMIIGSDDPSYTASKIYPYIIAKKPLLALFNSLSSAAVIINKIDAGIVAPIENRTLAKERTTAFFNNLASSSQINCLTKWDLFDEFKAKRMTEKQCDLFNKVTIIN